MRPTLRPNKSAPRENLPASSLRREPNSNLGIKGARARTVFHLNRNCSLALSEEVCGGARYAVLARAYPLRILLLHEIVNDVVGGRPVTITYCPLCNTAIVFDRELGGTIYDFGTTGKLRNSDLVMYDRQTETWWQQFTGEAIAGGLAGQKLRILPSRLQSITLFRSRFPNGEVLLPAYSNANAYQNPYQGYDRSRTPFLYSGRLPATSAPWRVLWRSRIVHGRWNAS